MTLRGILEKRITNKKLVLPIIFLIKMVLVYAAWRLIKFLGENVDNFLWGGWDWIKDTLGCAVSASTAMVLRMMGYHLNYYKRLIVVDSISGPNGIYIGDLCLGLAPLFIFTCFVLVFGNNTRNKLWFVPLGLLVIFATNVLRMVGLVWVQTHHNSYFKLAHEYVYVIFTYGAILLMLVWWMEKPAFQKSTQGA